MKKRCIMILCCVFAALVIMPFAVLADAGDVIKVYVNEYDELLFRVTSENTVSLTGGLVNGSYYYSSALTIPSVVEDEQGNAYTVTEIGADGVFWEINAAKVILPPTITHIGNGAFREAVVKSIEIPDSVIDIGAGAFASCTFLSSITLSQNLAAISDEMFFECSSLKQLTIPSSVTSIGEAAFACSGIESIIIPSSVQSMGTHAFYDSALKSVVINAKITALSSEAFYNCKSLASVVLPNTLKSIGVACFYNCKSLTGINLPDSLTTIGDYAFQDSGLRSILWPASLEKIEQEAFAYTELSTVIYPDKNVTMGSRVFYYCKFLNSVTIPEGVTRIPPSTFSGCDIRAVTIPTSVKQIGDNAFSDNSNLKTVTIPGKTGLQGIPFANCGKLHVICYPSSPAEIFCYIQGIDYEASLPVPSGIVVPKFIVFPAKNKVYLHANKKTNETVQLMILHQKGSELENKITWTCNTPKLAKVDTNGLVTPLAYGTAKFTATDSYGIKSTCTLTIQKDTKTKLKSITAKPTRVTLKKGKNKTITLAFKPSTIYNVNFPKNLTQVFKTRTDQLEKMPIKC